MQMMQPGGVVDAVRHLQKDHQVVRAEVQRPVGPAEIEALIFAQLALGILARVLLVLLLGTIGGVDDSFPHTSRCSPR